MSIHVLGCGNILKGDDGFGSAVITYLEENYDSKENVILVDAGLGCGEWIKPFIYDEDRPDKIIVVDALDLNNQPGELKVLTSKELPLMDLSLSSHFFPNKPDIEELEKVGVEIIFVTCQPYFIPTELDRKLSSVVKSVIPMAADKISKICNLLVR